MLEELFTLLYKKLESEKENDKKSKNGYFEYFVNVILENDAYKNSAVIISSKAIKNYYEKYVEKKENKSGEPKNDLKNIIANYLGFNDYLDFEKSFHETKNNKIILHSNTLKPSKKPLLISIAIVLFFSTIYSIYRYLNLNKENCIIWTGNRFKESNCHVKNVIDNNIYHINTELFKKVNVNKNTAFFKNGKNLIWYGKSAEGKIQFFSHRGVHPETLKELHHITEYIVNKYVYSNKKDKTIVK